MEMIPLTNSHHSQPSSSHTNVYPIMQQTYQSQQQPVQVLPLQQQQQLPLQQQQQMSTAITPRHQVVAQLQQLQMQQQQQQQPQLDYYNVSSQQQQQQQQRRRTFSRDSSRWSLLDEDDVTERDECGDQVGTKSIKFYKLVNLKFWII